MYNKMSESQVFDSKSLTNKNTHITIIQNKILSISTAFPRGHFQSFSRSNIIDLFWLFLKII